MPERILPQIDEWNKIEKSSSIQDTQEVPAIQRTLNTEYSKWPEVSWNDSRDAYHDGKILAYKYISNEYKQWKLSPEDGESVDIQNFIQIRNDLGKTFFDNMLYKYDIPYKEIVCLADDLVTADADRLEQIKNDLVTFLEEMHQDDSETVQEVTPTPTIEQPEIVQTINAALKERITTKWFTSQQAVLLNQKYLTDATATLWFDCSRDTNLVMKDWKVQKDKKWVEKTQGAPGLTQFLQPFTVIGNRFWQLFLTALLNDHKITYADVVKLSKHEWLTNALQKWEIGLTPDEYGIILSQIEQWTFNDVKFLEQQKYQKVTWADLLTAPDGESETHKWLREWQMRNAEWFATTIKKEWKSILWTKLDADSINNLSLWFTGQYNDVLGSRLDAFLLTSTTKKISTLQLATLEKEVKWMVNSALTAFLQDINTMQVKNWETVSACTSLSQTQEFSTPDNAYQFVKDNFSKSSGERKKLVLTGNTDAAPLTAKADHDALTTSLNSVISKIEGKLVNPTDQEKFTHKATELLSGIWEMGKGMVDRLKSEPVQDLIKVFQELFGALGMGTEFFDNLLKLNVLKESNLPPVALKAITEWEKLIDTASFKTIPLLDGGKPDITKLWNKIKDEKKLFDVAHFWDARSNELQGSRSYLTKQSMWQDTYMTLFKKFTAGNPGFAWKPDLLDIAMRNMCTQQKTPNIYADFYTKRTTWNNTESYTLFVNQFDLMLGRFTEDTKGEARTKTKSPNEVAVKGLLATMLDSRGAGIWVVKGSSNEVAQQVEGAKDVAEIKTLTEKVTMHVDADNKLTLDAIPAGTTLGIKVWAKDPVPYTGALPVTDLWNPPVFTLVKQESTGIWSSSVKIDAISVAQPTKTEIASDKSKVTLTWLPTTTYETRVQYTNTSNQTDLVAWNECTPATVWAPVDCALDAQKWTAKAITIKPKTWGLRQTVWKSA